MNRSEQLQYLNQILLTEMPQYREQAKSFPADDTSQRRLLRSLMNVRPPMPLDSKFLEVQDALLSAEAEAKGVVDCSSLPVTAADPRLVLWQGDITRLRADAIVDADNAALLGCFVPCHGCIDNAIHSAAGIQLRNECAELMEAQGREEPVGKAKITGGYNLPAKHVIHTVGPIVGLQVTRQQKEELRSCYLNCLRLAEKNQLSSIAFCCISTGEFHFPNKLAAKIAVENVDKYLIKSGIKRVIFNVFKDEDYHLYTKKFLGTGDF